MATKVGREALVFRDGQWKRPNCECAYHFWDGIPTRETYSMPVPALGAKDGMVRLTGFEKPHIHLCKKHQEGAPDAHNP